MTDTTHHDALIEAITPRAIAWRRHLHRHPELMYEVHDTARYVSERLREMGVDEVVTGLGRTGMVGVVKGDRPGPVTALRSDMDALPIHETTNLPHASTRPGVMHACGHDGHMAMLLAATATLAESRDFAGTLVAVFQPAEEGGAGARAMIEDGLMTRFGIERVYGMHNYPGVPVGEMALRPGPIMASTDEFTITITGKGGHAAWPNMGRDPVLAAAGMVTAAQQIASRNVDPLASVVVSITVFQAGEAHNVIPETAVLRGTIRALDNAVRALAEARLREVVAGVAAAHGVDAELDLTRGYPVVVNDAAETARCGAVARSTVGDEAVNGAIAPVMGGEDFAYMLEERPGAFVFLGNGDTAGLHHPAYDFNDEALGVGARYWVRLMECVDGQP